MLILKIMGESGDHLLISGLESVRFEKRSAIATFIDGRVEEYVALGMVYVLNDAGKTIDSYCAGKRLGLIGRSPLAYTPGADRAPGLDV